MIQKPTMKYRRLGTKEDGLDVSVIGLGCFAFAGDNETMGHLGKSMAALHANLWGPQDEKDTIEAVKAALDAGINLFDNAEMYGAGVAEEALGRALKASGYARNEYAIATKVSEAYLAPNLLREHLEQSLKRLQTDYVDIYQIHWHSRAALKTEKYPERPLTVEVPLEETLECLNQLRKEGKIKHIGVCNFGPEDIRRALKTGVPIVSNQISYSLLWRGIEKDLVPLCHENNIAILPWGGLLQGLLTGKYKTADEMPTGRARNRLFANTRPSQRHGEPGLEKEVFESLTKIQQICDKIPAPMNEVALSWLKDRKGVGSVLMGARTRDQVNRNLKCLELDLNEKIVKELDDVTDAIRVALGDNLDPYEGKEHSRIK
jgi:aryl-alcohol dehydrogenase-like predicted oxidoreductase